MDVSKEVVQNETVRKGQKMRKSAKLVALTVLFVSTGLIMPPLAHAEDDWQDWNVSLQEGEDIHRWRDNNTDSAGTAIHLSGCTSNPEVTLKRHRAGLPDVNLGSKIAWCLNTDGGWLNWGDQQAGTYFFTITDARAGSGDSVDVDYVHIGW